MKKILLLSFALVFWSPNLVATTDSQSARIHKRLLELGYELPIATVEERAIIIKELSAVPFQQYNQILESKIEEGCSIETLKIEFQLEPSSQSQSFLATLVRPERPVPSRKRPALVIQPTLAGATVLEQQIAKDACQEGFVSITPNEISIDLPSDLPDFHAYDRNTFREMVRAGRMIDFLLTQSDVHPGAIGVVGFSRGASTGALLAGIDSRIQYGFLGGGGVGFAEMIARTQTERGSADTLRHREAANMTQDEFEATLRETLRYEPLLFSDRVNGDRFKIMIIDGDVGVPTRNQELMRSALSIQESVRYTLEHKTSIIVLVFKNKSDYLDFLVAQAKKRLQTEWAKKP